MRWLGLAAALVAATALARAPAPAAAHGELVLEGTDPPPEAVLADPPGRVVLRFSEPLVPGLSRAAVTDTAGRRVQATELLVSTADPRLGVVRLLPDLPPGTYTVQWQSVSTLDGHRLSGRYRFHVRTRPAGAGAPPPEPGLGDAGWASVAARALRWAATTLWLGAAGWLWGCARAGADSPWAAAAPRWRALYARAVALAGLGALAELVLQAVTAAGGRPDRLLAAGHWGSVLGTRAGLAALAELVALPWLLGPASPARPGRAALAGATGAALLGLRAWSGHAAAVAAPRTSALVLDWVHLLAAAVWVGGGAALALAWHGGSRRGGGGGVRPVGDGGEGLARAARAFGPWAAAAVALLAVTGLLQAELQLGGAPVAETRYGRWLLAKLSLVALMLALAAWQALRLRPATAGGAGAPVAPRRGAWALRLEAAAGVAVLATVAVLNTLTPPARQQGLPPEPPAPGRAAVTVAEQVGDLAATITIYPASLGANRVEVVLVEPDGRPAAVRRLEVAHVPVDPGGAADASRRTAPVQARATGPGRFTAALWLPAEGRWRLTLRAERPGRPPAEGALELQLPVPGGLLVLERAEAAMNALQSLVIDETLSGGGRAVVTRYHLAAPDRMRAVTEGGAETVLIGERRWTRLPGGTWQEARMPGGLRWPDYRWSEGAREVALLGRERVGGVPAWVVSFLDPAFDARYRLWVAEADGRVHRLRMIARGHFMTWEMRAFDEPVAIEPPAR